jgi:ketosteroid isomerase-like protein
MGQAREVLDRLTETAVNQRDVDNALELYAADAVVVTPDAGEIRGREGIRDYWVGFVDAFSDSHYDSTGKYEAGSSAIDEGYYVGTHTAPLTLATGESVPPTGKQLKLRSCDIAKVEEGKIVEHHLYFDQAAFLEQLGIEPSSSG